MSWEQHFKPGALGKFCSSESLLKILAGGSLLWSRPGRFNDPFDCNPHFSMPKDASAFLIAVQREFAKALLGQIPSYSLTNELGRATSLLVEAMWSGKLHLENVLDLLRDDVTETLDRGDAFLRRYREEMVLTLHKSKVLCLTKAFDNILMWSHYADCHRGALVVFAAQTENSQFSIAKPVGYTEFLPEVLSVEEFAQLLTGQISMTDDGFVRRAYDKITLTKSDSWSYEKEWRIVAGDGFDPEKVVELNRFSLDDVLAVVFGAKFADFERNALIEHGSRLYPSAMWYQATLSDTKFALDITKLT